MTNRTEVVYSELDDIDEVMRKDKDNITKITVEVSNSLEISQKLSSNQTDSKYPALERYGKGILAMLLLVAMIAFALSQNYDHDLY